VPKEQFLSWMLTESRLKGGCRLDSPPYKTGDRGFAVCLRNGGFGASLELALALPGDSR